MANTLALLVHVLVVMTAASTSDPKVKIKNGCPKGESIIAKEIRIDTQGQCTCLLLEPGTPPGTAEWRTSDKKTVGDQGPDGSSILTLSYSASDPSPTYYCTAVRASKDIAGSESYKAIFYDPNKGHKSTASATSRGITGLQAVVIALGVLSSLITSHVS